MTTKNIFEEVKQENSTDDKVVEELTSEELAELMSAYKKELARIYKLSSAKKSSIASQNLSNSQNLLKKCDQELRSDIDNLKKKFGIHY